MSAKDRIRVGNRTVGISNPDKELFSGDRIIKAELIDYYRSVARPMLTHLRGRPLAMERHPDRPICSPTGTPTS